MVTFGLRCILRSWQSACVAVGTLLQQGVMCYRLQSYQFDEGPTRQLAGSRQSRSGLAERHLSPVLQVRLFARRVKTVQRRARHTKVAGNVGDRHFSVPHHRQRRFPLLRVQSRWPATYSTTGPRSRQAS